ncbi:MAG: Fic family protein [Candidatus Methylacidiphilales bacterium]|nr:Fic family protein [Candidatus Methylacidiphilales bacterium]
MGKQESTGTPWNKLQGLGLKPDIKDIEAYEQAYQEGMTRALKTLVTSQSLAVIPALIKSIHYAIFYKIHTWAGEFRSRDETVTFDKGRVGADASKIEGALEECCQKYEVDISQCDPPGYALALATLHGSIRSIHPFRDGNTRTSAVLLEAQIQAIYGPQERSPLMSESLKPFLQAAYEGNPYPLASMILRRGGLEVPNWPEKELSRKVTPKLDENFETEWQKKRAEILRQQEQK